MDESSPHTGREAPADIDLYCLSCGYNLRGLSGDPRRCPECGYDNPLGDLVIPAHLIQLQLRNMETAPVISIAALLVASVILPPIALNASAACAMVGLGVVGLLVAAGATKFRSSCLGKSQWAEMFVKFQLIGLGATWSALAPMIAIFVFRRSINQFSYWAGAWIGGYDAAWWLTTLVILGLGSGSMLYFALSAYPRLRAELDDLQREVAVTIARDELRRRLGQQRR